MKHFLIFSLFLSLVFPAFAQYELKADLLRLESSTKTSNQFTYQHLRIYPIYAGQIFLQEHADIGQYDNLKQALEAKKVVITEVGPEQSSIPPRGRRAEPINRTEEVQELQQTQIQQIQNIEQQVLQLGGSSAQVNKLMIENVSSDSIFLMAGEVVKGGKQDRVLAQDVVLPPNSGKVDLGVFCVEHSRWSVREGGSYAFGGYFGMASNKVRGAAVVDKDQNKVWKNVDEVTKANAAMTETQTLTALSDSKDYQEQLNGYLTFFLPILQEQANCVGFVGVTGDKVIGMDVFATPALFQNQVGQLLNAYITESISEGSTPKMKEKEVEAYVTEFLGNANNQEKIVNERGSMFKRGEKTLHLSTY